MNPVQAISYVVAVTYLATFVYLILVWNKDDKNKR
jgi:hypothetical protein